MNTEESIIEPTNQLSPWGRTFDVIAAWSHRAGAVALVTAIASRNLFPAENVGDGSGIYFFPAALLCGFCLIVERIVGIPSPRLLGWGIAWLALIAAWVISTSFAEYRYPAELMTWEWVGVGLVCLYAAHWGALSGPKNVAILIVTLALMQALLACYEAGVTIPQLRALYEKNDEAFVKAMRQIGVERGGAAEEAFRNRLYSTEPLGTTGHPNSLAGLLVLAIPLTLLLAWNSLRTRGWSILGMMISLAVTALIVATLLLSKSRSAWVAAVVAIAVFLLLSGVDRSLWRKYRSLLLIGFSSLAIIVGGLIYAGVLDPLVITQSGQSMQYRWEWWQGSVPVIRDNIVVGVGPGNFRGHYLMHKLPFSSEEISDPHNFLVELWATGGLLALMAYIALLVVGLHGAIRSNIPPAPYESAGLGMDSLWWLGIVVATTFVAVFDIGLVPLIASLDQYPQILALPFAAILLGIVQGTSIHWNDRAIRHAAVAGTIGLHVHWLAAGGVAFPSLMMALWGLLGASSGQVVAKSRFPFWGHAATAGILAAITIGYSFSLLIPRVERDLAVEKARTIEEEIGRSQPKNSSAVTPQVWTRLVPYFEEWANACRVAAESVPGDRQGWERLATAEMSRMRLAAQLRSPNEMRSYRAAVKAWDQVIALDPRRSESHRQLGSLYHEVSASKLDPAAIQLAIEEYRKAALLYPNSAARRWELGNILSEQNRRDEATVEFKRALELDKTPHLDKKLSDIQRKVAEKYLSPSP